MNSRKLKASRFSRRQVSLADRTQRFLDSNPHLIPQPLSAKEWDIFSRKLIQARDAYFERKEAQLETR